MMGFLWWHQFDSLGMSVTSLTTPLQLSVLISEWNAYFTTSNQFTVEKKQSLVHADFEQVLLTWPNDKQRDSFST